MGNAAQAMVARGEVQTDIRRKIRLEDAPDALAEYVREMSKGKMLFELG
jgi:hypothetical protein